VAFAGLLFLIFRTARPVSLLFEVFVVSKFEVLGQIVNQNPRVLPVTSTRSSANSSADVGNG
jgi:hypothetical protein